jgi:phosphoribosylformylglycinamidine cyclo-ligase
VGVVNEEQLLGPDRVQEGDVLVALPSSGLHSNGFSLVRKLVEHHGLRYDETPQGLDRPLGEALLEPTLIYVPAVLAAAREGLIRSVAHITGGGVSGNLPRALPGGLGAEIDRQAWTVPPIIDLIANLGNLDRDELLSTFNMGIGAILVADPDRADDLVTLVRLRGFEALAIGRVAPGSGVRLS